MWYLIGRVGRRLCWKLGIEVEDLSPCEAKAMQLNAAYGQMEAAMLHLEYTKRKVEQLRYELGESAEFKA